MDVATQGSGDHDQKNQSLLECGPDIESGNKENHLYRSPVLWEPGVRRKYLEKKVNQDEGQHYVERSQNNARPDQALLPVDFFFLYFSGGRTVKKGHDVLSSWLGKVYGYLVVYYSNLGEHSGSISASWATFR
jgi:hypothetical protein